MNKVYFILLLCLFSSCRMNKTSHVETGKTENGGMEQCYDQSDGMEILDTLGKVYGNEPHMAGLSLETPNCPDFIEGIYFDKATLVFQATGDTVKARQILEKASGSKNFRIELTGGSNYSQTQLLAIQKELSKKMEESGNEHIKNNVTGYGVGLRHVEINLIMNTPERRKEFREKIMDSPAFQFYGVEEPIINQKVGVDHMNGIYIRPEYPVYSTKAEQAIFILNNHSGGTIECGEPYYITFEDEKGIWRELPMNATFVSLAYAIQDKGERMMRAWLYPDVHPNKAGRYRYFYEVSINRKPILLMAEFRLTDNEKEWKEAKKTPLPNGLLAVKQNSISPTGEEQIEEPVYDVVEVMPEFPGGMRAMLDFIEKNIRYPEVARKNGIQGRVIVGVVIDENGSVINLTVLRGIDPHLDKEALRVIRLMPKWQPGTQEGKALKVKYTIPVSFKLADSIEK